MFQRLFAVAFSITTLVIVFENCDKSFSPPKNNSDTLGSDTQEPVEPETNEPVDPKLTWWISPTGSDTASCTSKSQACRSWLKLLAKLEGDIGIRPLEIIFACGDYPVKTHGPFSGGPSLKGTESRPILIRSETPKCASIIGDGSRVFHLSNPSWITISEMRFTQEDKCFGQLKCAGGANDQGACETHSQCPGGECHCSSCSHPGDKQCTVDTFRIEYAENLTVSKNEMVKNNRFYNSSPLVVHISDLVKIEENRVYGGHRHLISYRFPNSRCIDSTTGRIGSLCGGNCDGKNEVCLRLPSDGTTHAVISGNYANGCVGGPNESPNCSKYSDDLKVGWKSTLPKLADECISVYYGNDVAVINNIVENCTHLGSNIGELSGLQRLGSQGGGDGNFFANNVLRKYELGLLTSANSGTGGPNHIRTKINTGEDNVFFNNVSIGATRHGSLFRDGAGTVLQNNTFIRSNISDFNLPHVINQSGKWFPIHVDWTPGVTDGTDPCKAPATSITIDRNFYAGQFSEGATNRDALWKGSGTFDHICSKKLSWDAYCDALGNCGQSVDPGRISQFVFIPEGDPRKSGATGGKPVGADIRCMINEAGRFTSIPMWDLEKGPFRDNPQKIVTQLLGGKPSPLCNPDISNLNSAEPLFH